MSTLAEIESAAEALPPEQKEALVRFLTASLRSGQKPTLGARLVEGPAGTMLLEAPPGVPPMTPAAIKKMLEDFP